MITQAMWDSYQAILTTHTEQAEAINNFLYNNIEHPYVTRMLVNESNTNEQDVEGDSEDNGEGNEGYSADDGGEGNMSEGEGDGR